jgi:hypothetical protein
MGAERRRVLIMLADAEPYGHTYPWWLLACGVHEGLLSAIVRDGQAVAVSTVVRTGGKRVPISYLRITRGRRKALYSWSVGAAQEHCGGEYNPERHLSRRVRALPDHAREATPLVIGEP